MFESVVIRKHDSATGVIDPGLIAETLLFYGNVHILAERGPLIELLKTVGADNVLTLIASNAATVTLVTGNLGTVTTTINGIQYNKFASMRFGGKGKARLTKAEEFHEILERALGKSVASRKMTKTFVDRISVKRQLAQASGSPGNAIEKLAERELNDPAFVRRAVTIVLNSLVPTYINRVRVDLVLLYRYSCARFTVNPTCPATAATSCPISRCM